MSFLHSFARDGLTIFAIIIVNFLILAFVRKVVKKKRLLMQKESQQIKKANKSQNNLTKMVLLTSTIIVISHLLIMVCYFPINALQNNKCLRSSGLILLYLSYSSNFFVYFAFNPQFRAYVSSKFSVFTRLPCVRHLNKT